MYDILITNARLFDPSIGLDRTGSLAVRDGAIVHVDTNAGNSAPSPKATTVIDARGRYLLPALTDDHVHVFTGGCEFAAHADALALPSGVGTVVDGGTAGCANFEAFYRTAIVNAAVDIRAMLNVCTIGQPAHAYRENHDPALVDKKQIARLCREYPERIVALKLRQSRPIVREWGLEPLRNAVRLANEVGVRLVVHASDSPGDIAETLELLRPGDVFCHIFHKIGETILDENGRVRKEVFKAKERGVLFDMARGISQFSHEVAQAAFTQGFFPDIVSSDGTAASFGRPPSYCFSHVMSEALNMGMDFGTIITACTTTPQSLIGGQASGFLKEGSRASLTLLEIVEQKTPFTDKYGSSFHGERIIKPAFTILDGKILFRQFDDYSIT